MGKRIIALLLTVTVLMNTFSPEVFAMECAGRVVGKKHNTEASTEFTTETENPVATEEVSTEALPSDPEESPEDAKEGLWGKAAGWLGNAASGVASTASTVASGVASTASSVASSVSSTASSVASNVASTANTVASGVVSTANNAAEAVTSKVGSLFSKKGKQEPAAEPDAEPEEKPAEAAEEEPAEAAEEEPVEETTYEEKPEETTAEVLPAAEETAKEGQTEPATEEAPEKPGLVASYMENIGKTAGEWSENIIETAKELGSTVGEIPGKVAESVSEAAEYVMEGAGSVFDKAAEGAKQVGGTIVEAYRSVKSKMSDLVRLIDTAMTTFDFNKDVNVRIAWDFIERQITEAYNNDLFGRLLPLRVFTITAKVVFYTVVFIYRYAHQDLSFIDFVKQELPKMIRLFCPMIGKSLFGYANLPYNERMANGFINLFADAVAGQQ